MKETNHLVQILLVCIVMQSLGICSKNYYDVDRPERTCRFSNIDHDIPNRYVIKQHDEPNNDGFTTILDSIRECCGELCNIPKYNIHNATQSFISSNTSNGKKTEMFESFTTTVDCFKLWNNDIIDKPSLFCAPPRRISKFLERQFTYGGQLGIQYSYYNSVPSTNKERANQVVC